MAARAGIANATWLISVLVHVCIVFAFSFATTASMGPTLDSNFPPAPATQTAAVAELVPIQVLTPRIQEDAGPRPEPLSTDSMAADDLPINAPVAEIEPEPDEEEQAKLGDLLLRPENLTNREERALDESLSDVVVSTPVIVDASEKNPNLRASAILSPAQLDAVQVAGEGGGGAGTTGGPGIGVGGMAGGGTGEGSGNGTASKGDGVEGPAGLARPPGRSAKPRRTLRGEYPEEARRKGIEGIVVVLLEVLADGRVGTVEVTQSSGYRLLDDAARKMVSKWQFVPAEEGGRAVASKATVKYVYRLSDAR